MLSQRCLPFIRRHISISRNFRGPAFRNLMAEASAPRLSNDPKGFSLQHINFRVRDGELSSRFYQEHFSMRLVDVRRYDAYTLYYLGSFAPEESLPEHGTPEAERLVWTTDKTLLELKAMHDTTKDSPPYHNGNVEPRGFGHVGFIVDDVYEFAEELERKGVGFQKRPTEGKMKGIAFALDPDGYWVELVKRTPGSAGAGRPSLQQVMMRIKDPAPTLAFYRDTLGMTVVREKHFPEWEFSLYFLASLPAGTELPDPTSGAAWDYINGFQGTCLELTHNHGTEKEEVTPYHNGNTDPLGFGHFGFLCDDVPAAVAAAEATGSGVQVPVNDKGVAFVRDPDGYWVEFRPRGWKSA